MCLKVDGFTLRKKTCVGNDPGAAHHTDTCLTAVKRGDPILDPELTLQQARTRS